jgi:uncharacterized membrane protein
MIGARVQGPSRSPRTHPQENVMIARRVVLGSLAAAGALVFAGCAMTESMMGNSMSVPLSGRNEVPPNASTATGTGKVDLDGNVLKWTVTYQGLSGPVTGGHFHGPAPAGANAGVVLPFTGSLASPITGTATLTPAQLADVKAGLWYINLHTAAYPGGEIRGQVK